MSTERGSGGRDGALDEALSDLVRRAQHEDVLAMDQLLSRLWPFITSLCAPIALQDAEDAAQESAIAIFRYLPRLQEPAALFGWVRTICVREAVRAARRRHRVDPAELPDVPARGDPQLAIDIHDVLRRLSPEHRATLVLRDLEMLDEQTTAEILKLPLGTVRSRLFRARRSFRQAWS
jgi:RNA polymerase sigma factor (sigma-70 family)